MAWTDEDNRAFHLEISDRSLGDYPTFRRQYVDCRKPKCTRCKRGPSHGPYWYAEWKASNGKVRTRYIGKHLPRALARFVEHMGEGSWKQEARELAAIATLDIAHHDELEANERAGVEKTAAKKPRRRAAAPAKVDRARRRRRRSK